MIKIDASYGSNGALSAIPVGKSPLICLDFIPKWSCSSQFVSTPSYSLFCNPLIVTRARNAPSLLYMLVKKQHQNTNVLVSNDSLQTAYQPSQPVLPVQVSSYPLQGITYFATHPSLWCRFIFHLTIAVILVLVVIVLLFVFAFPAQAIAFARFVPQGWAWTISVFLCIVESAVATILVGLIYLQAIALDDIFDIVMRVNYSNSASWIRFCTY